MYTGSPASRASAHRLLEAQYRESLAPVTELMFAEAGIGVGQRVLDIGAGAGDTTFIAAERVGPNGRVLAIDASAEAIDGLVARLRALPEPLPISVGPVGAESLVLEPESFDVALARNSVMYFADLPRALGNIRGALCSGGRFVASVYGSLEREPFHAIPIAAVRRRCAIREPYPDYVQAFRLGAANLERMLLDAGFSEVAQHVVPTMRSFPSLAAAIEVLRLSRSLGQLLSVLPEDQREGAWADIAAGFRDHESATDLYFPGEQVVLVATA